jgi:hypothetical protein
MNVKTGRRPIEFNLPRIAPKREKIYPRAQCAPPGNIPSKYTTSSFSNAGSKSDTLFHPGVPSG